MLTVDENHKQKILIASLKMFCKSNKIRFRFEDYPKHTESLYRFGYFYFNHTPYSISKWSFVKKNVVLTNEITNEKMEYDYINQRLIKGNLPNFNIMMIIRLKLSRWLKDLSDKLQY